MSLRFFDSSALGKRYHAEVGTAKVNALIHEAGFEAVISRLTLIEIQSVFAGKVRTGAILASDFDLLRRRFLTEVCQRILRVARLSGLQLQEAERLIRQHGVSGSLRTLDALQLAVAIDLKKREGLTEFVCADKRLCNLAMAEGLIVIDPELP
jgi:predicted nucleic acid-binding protein